MIGPAGPKSVTALYDELRTEATERCETAIDALRGVPLEPPEDQSPTFHPPVSTHEIVLEDPRTHPENPYAAILGHISEAERLYIAAHELEHLSRQQTTTTDRLALNIDGNHHLDREFRELKHELRDEAHEAIRDRLETQEFGEHTVIKDPATGWKKRVAIDHLEIASDRHQQKKAHRERAPKNVLESIVHEISKHRPEP